MVYDKSSSEGLLTNYTDIISSTNFYQNANHVNSSEGIIIKNKELVEKFFVDGVQLSKNINSKRICPSLEGFRSYFFDADKSKDEKSILGDSFVSFPDIKSMNHEQSFDNPLNESLFLENMDNKSIISQLEKNIENENEILDNSDFQNNYEVENFSEHRQLKEDLNREVLFGQTQTYPSTAETNLSNIKYDSSKNVLSKEFEYWSCIEPEKWKMKTLKIKRIKKNKVNKKLKNKILEENHKITLMKNNLDFIFENGTSQKKNQNSNSVLKINEVEILVNENINLDMVNLMIPIIEEPNYFSLFSTSNKLLSEEIISKPKVIDLYNSNDKIDFNSSDQEGPNNEYIDNSSHLNNFDQQNHLQSDNKTHLNISKVNSVNSSNLTLI